MSSTLSRLKRERGVSLKTLVWKRSSSHIEGEIHGFSRVAAGSLGFILSCDGDLRDWLVLPQRNQVSFRVAMGSSGFLSSHCLRIGPCLEFSRETQCSSLVASGISGFLSRFNKGVRPRLVLRHGILRSSRVVNGVSGLQSCSGGEFGLFQEDRQGRQASHPVVRGYSVFHWSRCRGIRTYLELRGKLASFFLAAGSAGFHSRIKR